MNLLDGTETISPGEAVREALEEEADVVEDEGSSYAVFEDGSQTAEVQVHENGGSFATVMYDEKGTATAALERVASEYEGVGMNRKQLQAYEPADI